MTSMIVRRSVLAAAPMGAAALMGCSHPSAPVAATADDDALFARLSELMGGAVASQNSAGVSFGLLRHAKAAQLGAYGVSSVATSAPVGAQTTFRIASVTKTFVAVGVMKMVENGVLALEQPISDFFPDYPRGREVTIYHLLTHTSGLKDWWEAGLPEGAPGDFNLRAEPHLVLERVSDPYNFAPGEHHWYSNTGFVLLGEIIEQMSGQSLEEYLRVAAFRPSGLTHTFFDTPDGASDNAAVGHHIAPDETPPFRVTDFVGSPGAAGGMRSTPEDMMRWSAALYSGVLVSGDTLAQMSEMARLADGRPVSESTWRPAWC
jgi:CubicO group peptidase (beta-lactamase class C family)